MMDKNTRRGGWIYVTKDNYRRHCRYTFLPWLRDITMRYKERGVFPTLPSDIATLYTDKRDQEAALLSSLIIPYSKYVDKNIREVYNMIGPNPYEWFKNGEYKMLSTGDTMNKLLFGSPSMRYYKLMPFFDDVARLLRKRNITEKDLFSINADVDRVKMVLVVMFSSDGIGLGLREPTKPLRCPNTDTLRKFMSMLLCKKFLLPEFEELTELFFENSIDFLYSYFAWKELERMYPANMTLLKERYKMFFTWESVFTRNWDEVLFEVNFNQ